MVKSDPNQAAATASAGSGPQAWPDLGLPRDFDMDLFLVTAGLRALGKWEGVPDAGATDARDRLERESLRTRVVPGPGRGESVVFFAADAATLDRAERLEHAYRATRSYAERAPSSRALGELLGYPACCVEAWAVGPQDDEGALYRLGASLRQPAPALLNFFPRAIAPVGFLPCDVRCPGALAHATRVADALGATYGVAPRALEESLRGVVLWLSGPIFLWFRSVSELDASGFRYDAVLATPELPGFPTTGPVGELGAEARALVSRCRDGRRLHATENGLFVVGPGHELPLDSARPLARQLAAFV